MSVVTIGTPRLTEADVSSVIARAYKLMDEVSETSTASPSSTTKTISVSDTSKSRLFAISPAPASTAARTREITRRRVMLSAPAFIGAAATGLGPTRGNCASEGLMFL